MTIAEQLSPPEVHSGFGFDWQTRAARDRRRAQCARVTNRCQLDRNSSGHHICEFPGGILLQFVGLRGRGDQTSQELDCVTDEGYGELDLNTSGKALASQKDRARNLIGSLGEGAAV